MNQEAKLEGKVVVSGQLECRDKDGVLLKVIDLRGEVPLVDLVEAKDIGRQLLNEDKKHESV
jgi:hypothetical protein